MIADKTLIEHDHMLDLLGHQFCREAYHMFYETATSIPNIAISLGQTVQDVKDALDAWELHLIGGFIS